MEEGTFGGKMELLKLSRFKFQLRALISEVRDLRERERSATEQLHLSIKKQKQSEEEFTRKLKELDSELASSIELRRKLERKVDYLQNDNALLENKQKELNSTIQNLLQSRDHFVNAYQDSTCELKRSIEARDRKLKVFSEKLRSHILLFDSIEKEALSVKQVVDNVRHLVCDKEETVTGLKRKLDRISEVEKVFIGKISEMEIQLERYKDEMKKKDNIISELEAKLVAENIDKKNQTQLKDLERALSMKDAVIQNLISEKQDLVSEVKSLGAILEKIQHTLRDMNEDEKVFQSLPESKERSQMLVEQVGDRVEDSKDIPAICMKSQPDLSRYSEYTEKNDRELHTAEEPAGPACSTTQLACSEPQPITNAQTMCPNNVKLESESSTSQADISEQPD